MLQDRDEAKDVMQGLFLDLLQRPNAPADLPYLYRAVTHRCLNHLRDRRNQGRLLADADETLRGPARTRLDERVVDRQLLASLVDRIDAQAWGILVYHFVDDLTQDEIAALIGTSRKTVVRRLQVIGNDHPEARHPDHRNPLIQARRSICDENRRLGLMLLAEK